MNGRLADGRVKQFTDWAYIKYQQNKICNIGRGAYLDDVLLKELGESFSNER